MIVQDECGLGKSRSRVSAGVANFLQLSGGWGNTFVFPRSLDCQSLVE